MSDGVKCWCQHCGVELPANHIGQCPNCHKTGKRCEVQAHVTIGVKTGASATLVKRSLAKEIERHLTKEEKALWRKIIDSVTNNIAIDGLEVGFPSGIKVIFRVKNKLRRS